MSKSMVAKKAVAGKDMGKKNDGKTTGFGTVFDKAMDEGYSGPVAKKVAGSQMQNMRKKGML